MTIAVSPKGSKYNSVEDTLEAKLDFELYNRAFINGMWLFLDDTVYINAKLMDKWTAGFIYEEIVSRCHEPSIFYKNDGGKYTVKIFPLIGNSTRTVKISCY